MDTGIKDLKVVCVQHYRFQKIEGNLYLPSTLHRSSDVRSWMDFRPTGGFTVVVVRDEASGKHHIGIARCHLDETFVKKEGRETALRFAKAAYSAGTKLEFNRYHRKERGAWQCIYRILRRVPLTFLADEINLKGLSE